MEKSHPDSCIFCGATSKLSREHIIPRWMRHFLPPPPSHHTRTLHAVSSGGALFRKGKISRPGLMTSQSLRCVCKPCNNGWMSRLQMEARHLLEPMIEHGTDFPRDEDARRLLARWMMMTAAVNEYADLPTVTLSQQDRDNIMSGDVTLDWFIGAARYEGTRWQSNFFHRAMKVDADRELHLAHITVVCLGKVALISVGASEGGRAVFRDGIRYANFHRVYGIWPDASSLLQRVDNIFGDEDIVGLIESTSGEQVVDPLFDAHFAQ